MTIEVETERALPWERIQTSFPEGTKFQEAIEMVGLDYEVEFRSLYAAGAGVLDDLRATVRTDTNKVLGIVGSRYQIVQNSKAFSVLGDILDSGDIVPLGAGYWKGGARPWIQARLPEDILIDGQPGEAHVPFIFTGTSHDGSMQVTTALSAIRISCKNTYAANCKAPRRFQIRHLASFEARVGEARRVLGISFAYFKEFQETMSQLATMTLTDETFAAFVNQLFPLPKGDATEAIKENVAKKRSQLLGIYLNSPTVPKGTKYGGLQAITEWYDHVKNGTRNKGTRQADERKSDELLLGAGVEWKDKAVELLVEVS